MPTRWLNTGLAAALLWTCAGRSPAASVVYVDKSAAGTNNGLSWANAFQDLQPALAYARANLATVDAIWIAEGSYRPAGAGGSRSASFALAGKLALYGGFPGGGGNGTFAARNPVAYVTTLSGDLNANDTGGLHDVSRSENSFHVVTANDVDAAAILDGVTITGGNANSPAANEGGGLYARGAGPQLANCRFIANRAEWAGGGFSTDTSNLTIADCQFINNWAGDHGGGMHASGSGIPLVRCSFTGNAAISGDGYGYGGGLQATGNNVVLLECAFTDNTVDGDGGGVENEGNGLALLECTFSGNQARYDVAGVSSGYGGGLASYGHGLLSLADCLFQGNSSGMEGGALTNLSDAAQLTGCTFTNNSAETHDGYGHGGGVYSATAEATLTNCRFEYNSADYHGGGLDSTDQTLTLTGCVFSGNTAIAGDRSGYGGGAATTGTGISLTNCQFANNRTDSAGGGLANTGHTLALNQCTFSDNSAETGTDYGQGGAVLDYSSTASVLQNCIFSNNGADGFGGAVEQQSLSATLISCLFTGNTLSAHAAGSHPTGGAVDFYQVTASSVVNCAFSGNRVLGAAGTVASGGAIFSEDSALAIINATLSANNAGAIGFSDSALTTVALTNTIVWGNAGGIPAASLAHLSANYCCIQGGWSGAGTHNINADPLFMDAKGEDKVAGTSDDDLRISAGSPCIDAGDNTILPGGITNDLAGNPRLVDDPAVANTGLGGCAPVDLGAWEFLAAFLDTDGDGVGDACDKCPLGDDHQDCNVNGIPDACDIAVDRLYWSNDTQDRIQRAVAQPANFNVETLVDTGTATLRGIAVDSVHGRIYWSDLATNTIRRSNLDGSHPVTVVNSPDGRAADLTLDTAGGFMYWAGGSTNVIRRSDLNGNNRVTLVSGLIGPSGLALDSSGGKLYWVNQTGNSIQRADLNGGNVQTLVNSGLSSPIDIALDTSGGKMYWAEFNGRKVRRANLDGTSMQDLASAGLSNPTSIALDRAHGKVYWSDTTSGKIQRAGLDGNGPEDVVTGLAGIFRLAFVPGSTDCDHNRVPDECQPDGDGDGWIDACDACPTTILGATVDATGCPPLIPGDFDRDGDVDDADFNVFKSCASGPAIPHAAGCGPTDLDADTDVDEIDFGLFQRCYSGRNLAGHANCSP